MHAKRGRLPTACQKPDHFHTSCFRKLLKIKVTRMPGERLPKKILYGELEMEKRSHCSQKKRYKTPSKPPSRTSTFQQSHGNKLYMTEQSGEATSEEVLVNMRQTESAEPSRNVHSAKSEIRRHLQSCLALTSVVHSPKDSL